MFLVLFALDIPSDSDYLVIRLPVTRFKRGASMAEKTPEDLTIQILIQIRDEMRAMHSSFDARFDALEKRMGSLEARMESLESRMDSLEARMDSLESRMGALEVRFDTLEAWTEARFKAVFRRLDQLGSDLKKFASVVNEAILHYADEMDTVRDRLSVIENKIGIVFPAE